MAISVASVVRIPMSPLIGRVYFCTIVALISASAAPAKTARWALVTFALLPRSGRVA